MKLNSSYLSNSNLIKVKREVSVCVYGTYSRICEFDINEQNDQNYTGTEPDLFPSADGLKHSQSLSHGGSSITETTGNVWTDGLTVSPLAIKS